MDLRDKAKSQASLAALSPHGQRLADNHMCASALRRRENREELGLRDQGNCVLPNSHAGPGKPERLAPEPRLREGPGPACWSW